jgi:hypothetical protein
MMSVWLEPSHPMDRLRKDLEEVERLIRALQAKRRWLKRELKLRTSQEVAA